MTTPPESALPGLLQQMIEAIKEPHYYYWLYANYFDILPPTDRSVTQWWQAPLFLDSDALWNPTFEEDAMLMDVILRNERPAIPERIRIEYSQIWSLKRFYKGQTAKETDWTLYHNSSKLRMPPTHSEQ
jgi:hypothetical protein